VLGYEVNEKIFDTIDRSVSSPPIASRTPRAVYAQAVAAGRVWDGQTMVVATEAGKDAPAATDQRTWLFFITPIVIDPAGNRVFTPDDLLFSNEWVPPQR
jgi:hypothetical protein